MGKKHLIVGDRGAHLRQGSESGNLTALAAQTIVGPAGTAGCIQTTDGYFFTASTDFTWDADDGLYAAGDIEAGGAGSGLILTSPEGIRWRFTVSGLGELVPEQIDDHL